MLSSGTCFAAWTSAIPTSVRSKQGRDALRETLAEWQCLLIVDDVCSTAAANAFAVTGPHGRVVFTTRDTRFLDKVNPQIVHIDVLSEALARSILARLSDTRVEDFPTEVRRVLAGTGRVTFALALVGAAVRGGTSWTQIATKLDRGDQVFGAHPYATTFKALQIALAALDIGVKELYLSLAVFPVDTRIPICALARYWKRLRGYTTEQTRTQLCEFANRQLLGFEFDDEVISFNDLQHNYLLLQVDNLHLDHTELLEAYRDLLPARSEWSQLPEKEP